MNLGPMAIADIDGHSISPGFRPGEVPESPCVGPPLGQANSIIGFNSDRRLGGRGIVIEEGQELNPTILQLRFDAEPMRGSGPRHEECDQPDDKRPEGAETA